MSASEAHKHCLCGDIHSGVPTGKFEESIAGFKTYVALPKDNAQKDKAIFYITDVFAFDLVNHLLLADTYAEETGIAVYIPDFTEGDPVPLNAFQVGFDFGKWLATHNIERVLGFSHKFLAALKEKHAHVVAIGFCWGGYFSVELSTHADLIDAVVALHPSFLEVPKHVEHITKPSLWICAETDNQFDDAKRKGTQELLEKKGLPNKFVFYPGTTHGFSVRGNENDEHVNKAAKGAKDETVKFIREIYHL